MSQRHDLGWTVQHNAVAKNPLVLMLAACIESLLAVSQDATYDLPPSACYHIYTCTKALPTEVTIIDDLEDYD